MRIIKLFIFCFFTISNPFLFTVNFYNATGNSGGAGDSLANMVGSFGNSFFPGYYSRFKLACVTFGSGYCICLINLLKINHLLADQNSWQAWKPELSIEDLFDIPQQQLSEQLVKAIQKKYSSSANPADFVGPLIAFSSQIQNEIAQLESHLRLVGFIKATYLEKLFPDLKESFIKSRLQKLKYLSSIFKNWSAEYKAQKIERFYRDIAYKGA